MKYCPKCRTEYADDSLQFCLHDGTPLTIAGDSYKTTADETESETLVIPKQVEPIRFEPPSSYQTNQANWQPSEPIIVQQERKKSNTAMIVALSVLGTILLLGLGGLGAWLFMRNSRREIAVNINAAPPNRAVNSNAANDSNANSNLASPSPTATPTAQPTLKPDEAKTIVKDVKNVIDEWKDATEDRDIDAHLDQYADTVDYYKAGRVNVSKIRDDRARAFDAYDSLNINLDNVKVTPDPSGDKATVILDKEWNFEGEEKYSSGKVQQQLTFGKINGRWKITGEKDLKVYYVDK